jgi:hypothetical protein
MQSPKLGVDYRARLSLHNRGDRALVLLARSLALIGERPVTGERQKVGCAAGADFVEQTPTESGKAAFARCRASSVVVHGVLAPSVYRFFVFCLGPTATAGSGREMAVTTAGIAARPAVVTAGSESRRAATTVGIEGRPAVVTAGSEW